MENTLIIMAEYNKELADLNQQENKALGAACLFDILTEVLRLAECNPEMKILLCHPQNDVKDFWQNLNNDLAISGIKADKHFDNFYKKKVIYKHVQNQKNSQIFLDILQKESENTETENALLINTNCSMLIGEILDEAFLYLYESDMVLGGIKKGNIYLLGIHNPENEIFSKIDWNEQHLYEHVANTLESNGTDLVKMDVLEDFKDKENLKKIYKSLCQNGFATNTKKVIKNIIEN